MKFALGASFRSIPLAWSSHTQTSLQEARVARGQCERQKELQSED